MKKLVTSLFAVLLLVGVGNAKQATTQYERALINAAKEGNASQVRGLLEAGTDPNVTDKDGNTPLIYAAKENLASVDMLLFAGADVNARGENGITALINSFSIVTPEAKKIRERLLKAKPDVNAIMFVPNGDQAGDRMWGVSLNGEYRSLAYYGKSNPPLYGSATALSFAVATDDISAVETLLKNGADVNVPLMHSVLQTAVYGNKPNSTKIIELLLNAGADPSRVENFDKKNEEDPREELLKQATKNTDKKQQKLDTQLIAAVGKGNLKKVNKLLEQGANPNVRISVHYSTPLMESMCKKNVSVDVMKALIGAGADVKARNRSYSTALFYCDSTDGEKTKLLLKNGADVNARNMYGRTALFGAGGPGKAQALLEAGADVNARGYDGLSPLFNASIHAAYAQEAEVLKMHGAKLTPYEKQRIPLEQQKWRAREAEIDAKYGNDSKSGLGSTLLNGLLNAANDTANFAIQNAGKF